MMTPQANGFSKAPALTWNVFIEDFSGKRIVMYNVFRHSGFLNGCRQALEQCGDDRPAFEEAVRRELMYYYWSKCEWEIILSAWPPRKHFNEEKIDVSDQVMMNWPQFTEYLWINRKELLKRE